MNTFSRILLIVAAAMGLASCATARLTTEEKNNLAQAIQTGISEKNFEMEIRMMNPQRGRSRNVSGFSVEVKGDTLVSNLPYFGVVHSAPYGGGKGLNFESKINSYQTTQAKPDCTQSKIFILSRNVDYTEFSAVSRQPSAASSSLRRLLAITITPVYRNMGSHHNRGFFIRPLPPSRRSL